MPQLLRLAKTRAAQAKLFRLHDDHAAWRNVEVFIEETVPQQFSGTVGNRALGLRA